MKNLFFVLFAVLTFGLASCGGSDCSLESAAEEGEKYLALGITYNDDPTKENCDAYKEALESFVSDFEDCEETNIESQVTVAKGVIETLNCE